MKKLTLIGSMVAMALAAAAFGGDKAAGKKLSESQIRYRGKGRGTPSKRYGNYCNNGGRNVPHQNFREMERRKRQLRRDNPYGQSPD